MHISNLICSFQVWPKLPGRELQEGDLRMKAWATHPRRYRARLRCRYDEHIRSPVSGCRTHDTDEVTHGDPIRVQRLDARHLCVPAVIAAAPSGEPCQAAQSCAGETCHWHSARPESVSSSYWLWPFPDLARLSLHQPFLTDPMRHWLKGR
jgi:hypothetical protein